MLGNMIIFYLFIFIFVVWSLPPALHPREVHLPQALLPLGRSRRAVPQPHALLSGHCGTACHPLAAPCHGGLLPEGTQRMG